MNPTPEITLANLAGGALMETATDEMRRISENIMDPNVAASAKRKLTVEILFEPDDTRQMVKMTYQVKASMPGRECGKTVAIVNRDPETGLGLYEAFVAQPLEDLAEPLQTRKSS